MNPSDLLFTNQYISPKTNLQDLHTTSFSRKDKAYEELKRHIQQEVTQDTNGYREQRTILDRNENNFDLLEPSINQPSLANILNRPEWIVNEEPLSLQHGTRPIFAGGEDTGKYRYKKLIVSYINIDSRDRNKNVNPDPSNYTIYLNKQFNYVQTIRMASIEFREPPKPINKTNNCICWETKYEELNDSFLPDEITYETRLSTGYYTMSDFVQEAELTFDNVKHERTIRYYANGAGANSPVYIDGSFPSFRLTIDPYTRLIRLIQRLDEFKIINLSSTANTNEIRLTIDVGATVPPAGGCSDTNVPFTNTEHVPLLIAGLELFVLDIGGIPINLIDQIPFYPDTVTTTSNYYTCNGVVGNNYVYTLHVYHKDNTPALAKRTVTVDPYVNTLPVVQGGHSSNVDIGRALEFTFPNECSFSSFLGIQNGNQYAYIHTNLNKDGEVMNVVPWKIIGIGQLALDTNDYIFMRLRTPFMPLDTISGNLICARGSSVGMNNVEKTDEFDYFSKIIFSDLDPGNVSTRFVGADRIFYDAPLVKLTNLTVEFYNQDGELVDTVQDHSFTLQIIEERHTLKETLIDSRTGGISDTGSGLITTNPV